MSRNCAVSLHAIEVAEADACDRAEVARLGDLLSVLARLGRFVHQVQIIVHVVDHEHFAKLFRSD